MTSGTRFSFRAGSGATLGGKIASSLFLCLFAALGLAFCGFFVHYTWNSSRTWFWQRTNCEILASSVVEDREGNASEPYRFDVSYRYSINGVEHTSKRFTLGNGRFSDYSKAAQTAARFPAESTAACFVDPKSPGEAVLARGNLLILPFVLIPLVFVAVGVGGLYTTWRKPRLGVNGTAPISEQASGRTSRFTAVFFGLFLAMGLGFSWIFFFRPVVGIWQARSWRATPCRVLSSQVQRHSDSDGTTYSVDILYEYEVGGRIYKSSRYHFLGGSSSGYAGKAAVVAKYPASQQAMCYVNPANPAEAVIERGFTADVWFGLLPIAFVVIGAGGIYFTVRRRPLPASHTVPISGSRTISVASALPVADANAAAPRQLRPGSAPLGRLIASILVAAFWNGIVSIFVTEAVRGFQRGRPEWFLTIFLVPFVLIGLGMIVWIGYNLLALFNPRPRLVLTPGELRVGDSFEVSWEIAGRVAALERLEIRLEGREVATYRRGTSTTTDQSLFARIPVATASLFQEMRQGHARAMLPTGAMHTFTAPNNKIVWSLRVHGRIARWPDVSETFLITVQPAPTRPPTNA